LLKAFSIQSQSHPLKMTIKYKTLYGTRYKYKGLPFVWFKVKSDLGPCCGIGANQIFYCLDPISRSENLTRRKNLSLLFRWLVMMRKRFLGSGGHFLPFSSASCSLVLPTLQSVHALIPLTDFRVIPTDWSSHTISGSMQLPLSRILRGIEDCIRYTHYLSPGHCLIYAMGMSVVILYPQCIHYPHHLLLDFVLNLHFTEFWFVYVILSRVYLQFSVYWFFRFYEISLPEISLRKTDSRRFTPAKTRSWENKLPKTHSWKLQTPTQIPVN
jgi:hypothetical protein